MRKLTGKYYFKKTLFAIILYVQLHPTGFDSDYKWVKAKQQDIQEIFK